MHSINSNAINEPGLGMDITLDLKVCFTIDQTYALVMSILHLVIQMYYTMIFQWNKILYSLFRLVQED